MNSERPRSIPIVGGRPREFKSPRAVSSMTEGRPFQGRADITLINMNLLYINMDGKIDFEIHPPLGLLYLTSVLEQAGYVVDLVDYQVFHRARDGEDPFDLTKAIEYIGETAEVIGLSCMANLLPFTLLVAKRLKELDPRKTIVLGGVGPFGVEEAILRQFGWVDVIVRAEGEVTALELLRVLREKGNLGSVRGIAFRNKDGGAVRTADRPRIEELDAIPFPAYHRLEMKYYDAFGVVTSRGCPYGCKFCSVAPIWDHQASYRSHEGILREIRLLHENYGVKHVLFQDEFFYSGEAKIIDFCDRLEASGLDITWKCFGRVNLVTEKAMRRMAEAGCIQIRFGIESGSDRVLSRVVKGFRFGEALQAVTLAVQIFRSVETFFIWGFPFEGMEDFHQTAIQMARFRQMGVTVLPSLLSMLPQTGIYHDYQQGLYKGGLSLVPELVPIYVVTGHEVLGEVNTVPERHRPYYDFIGAHPEVFPGFFLFDYERNVLPKYLFLKEIGFA